jgi:hypothetical protein
MIVLRGVAKQFTSAHWPWQPRRSPVQAVCDVSLTARDGPPGPQRRR